MKRLNNNLNRSWLHRVYRLKKRFALTRRGQAR